MTGAVRGPRTGALTLDCSDARYASSSVRRLFVSLGGISIRKPVRLSLLREIWIRGGSDLERSSIGTPGSRRIGGADASSSVSALSGGAEGRSACSRCANADLLILARELAL